MASVKTGHFTVRSGTGTQAVTGVGFRPKALIFWSQLLSQAANAAPSYTAFQWSNWGLAADTGGTPGQMGYSATENDNSAPSDVNSSENTTQIIHGVSYLNSGEMTAPLSSMDADGFTLNWTINLFGASGAGWNYLAIGGTGVTAKLVIVTGPAGGGLPVQAVTGVGFTPTAVVGVFSPIGGINDAGKALGWCDGDLIQRFTFINAKNAQNPTKTRRLQRTDSFIGKFDSTTDAITARGRITSLDVDGFTMNWDVQPGFTGNLAALCLSGVTCKAGTVTQPAATGTQAITGLGIQPKGVLFVSANSVASTTVDAELLMSIGASDGTTHLSDWTGSKNGNGLEQSARGNTTRSCVLTAAVDAAGVSATTAEAAMSSFDINGFTLNWTTADATARAVSYLAIGDLTVPVTITTTSLPTATSGTAYNETIAATGGTLPYTFSLLSGTLPPGLSLASSGVVSGTPEAIGTISPVGLPAAEAGVSYSEALSVIDTEGSYPITVRVTDANLITDDQDLTIALTGTGPYTYAVVAGSLPPSLSLSAGGVISGSPTGAPAIAPYPLADGFVDTLYSEQLFMTGFAALYSFTVRATIGTVSPPDQDYTIFTTFWNSLTTTYAVVLGALPKCLTCSSSGLISGLPMQVGTATFTIRATDNVGRTVDRAFALTSTS